MKIYLPILAAVALFSSAASADDHLYQASHFGGLTFVGDDTFNKAGKQIPDTALVRAARSSGKRQKRPQPIPQRRTRTPR